MDPGQIAPLLSSVNAIGTIVRGMVGVRDAAVIQQKVVELQSEIIAAQGSAIATQAAHAALIQELESLKRRLKEIEAWDVNAGEILHRRAGAKIHHGNEQEGPRYRGPSCF